MNRGPHTLHALSGASLPLLQCYPGSLCSVEKNLKLAVDTTTRVPVSTDLSAAKCVSAQLWISTQFVMCLLQNEEMALPSTKQGDDTSKTTLAPRSTSISLGRLSIEKQSALFQKHLPSAAKPEMGDNAVSLLKPPAKPEAGKRGQSQYAQFLRRSSIDIPEDCPSNAQLLDRRSASMDAPESRDMQLYEAQLSSPFAAAAAKRRPDDVAAATAAADSDAAVGSGRAPSQKLERRPSRVHFVAAQQSADGDCESADHVQEAASHREQMADAANEQEERPQRQRKSLDRQLTFQEMLRQQIQVCHLGNSADVCCTVDLLEWRLCNYA